MSQPRATPTRLLTGSHPQASASSARVKALADARTAETAARVKALAAIHNTRLHKQFMAQQQARQQHSHATAAAKSSSLTKKKPSPSPHTTTRQRATSGAPKSLITGAAAPRVASKSSWTDTFKKFISRKPPPPSPYSFALVQAIGSHDGLVTAVHELAQILMEPAGPVSPTCKPPPPPAAPPACTSTQGAAVMPAFSGKPRLIAAKIVYTVLFSFEVDLLEILLHEVAGSVDHVLLVEAPFTHQRHLRKPVLWDSLSKSARFSNFSSLVLPADWTRALVARAASAHPTSVRVPAVKGT